jgi:hypothetical protein
VVKVNWLIKICNKNAINHKVADIFKEYGLENQPKLYVEKIIEIMSNTKLYQKVSKQAYCDLYNTWKDTTEKFILNIND